MKNWKEAYGEYTRSIDIANKARIEMSDGLYAALKSAKGWCPSAEKSRLEFVNGYEKYGKFYKPAWAASLAVKLEENAGKVEAQVAIEDTLKGVDLMGLVSAVTMKRYRGNGTVSFGLALAKGGFAIRVIFGGTYVGTISDTGVLTRADKGFTVDVAETLRNIVEGL